MTFYKTGKGGDMSKISIIKIILCCLFALVLACMPAASSESLAESKHPYANNSEYKWPNISEPGATKVRLHFEYLKLGEPGKFSSNFQVYDKLILYDKYDNVLKTYRDSFGVNYQDFWTEWYTGDTLKVKLVTDSSGTANGLIIDKTETRMDEISSNPSGSSSSEDPKPKQREDFRHK
jgi:hypothetical protein